MKLTGEQQGQTQKKSRDRSSAPPEKLLLGSWRSVRCVSGLRASRGPLAPSALSFSPTTRPCSEQVMPSHCELEPPLLQAASPTQVSSGLLVFAGACTEGHSWAKQVQAVFKNHARLPCCAVKRTWIFHARLSCSNAAVSSWTAVPPARPKTLCLIS